MSHSGMILLIQGGHILRAYDLGLLTPDLISNIKCACYTHLQHHRHELDATRRKLKKCLPAIFHQEIDAQVRIIRLAEARKNLTSYPSPLAN